MAAITSTFDVRGGDATITLDPDDDTTLPSTTASASDLSSLEGDYDIEEDEEQASAVYFKLGELTISFFDRLGDGSSLFDELDDITSTTEIPLEFSFTTNASRSWTERFKFRPSDVKYDYRGREVTIKARTKADFTDTVADIFDNNAGDIEQIWFYGSDGTPQDQTNTTEDCMPASDYINNVLPLFNSGNININGSIYFDQRYKTDGVDSYVILDRSTEVAKNTLFRLAAAEGAIVGSFMGYNFYESRLNTSNNITVSESDIKELSPKIGLNSYLTIRNVFAMGIGTADYYSTAELTGDTDNMNSDALKRLDIFFSSGITEYVEWDDSNTFYDGFQSPPNDTTTTGVVVDGDHSEGATTIQADDGSGGNAPIDVSDGNYIIFENVNNFGREISPFYIADGANGTNTISIKTPLIKDISDNTQVWIINDVGINEIATSGVDAYAKAYGATGDRRLECTIFGIDTVKPYQSITFDSSFDAPLNGSTYRPSKITYNFTEDTIDIEAYQIA